MKKILIGFAFFCVLATQALQAQCYGSCSVILCDNKTDTADGKTNLTGLFDGFNKTAVGKDNTFMVYAKFQGYEVGKSHVRYNELVHTETGEVVLTSKKSAFILNGVAHTSIMSSTWTVNFPKTGQYTIATYVDGRIAQMVFFTVGE